ncbi:hypothetical protein CLOM_g22450 [Closterium sp. NIES-68]|nr:hypothetical protein CLOM_g22450 [Closterium sp. NIES-68]GJP70201.1 hypothetical protein CLOP_g1170 [Closterium sp. NIES-67]
MWKRLADAASAASRRAVAWRLEELQPPRERVLFDFARGEHGMMAAWRVYADDIYGGSSTATLAHSTSGNAEPAGSGRERLGMSSNDRGHEHGHEHGHDAMRGSDGADGRTDGGGMTHVSSKPRDVRRQHRHIAPPSSFVVFSGSLSSQLQEEPEDQGGGVGGASGGRLLRGGFAGIRTIETHPSCQHDLDAFSSLFTPLAAHCLPTLPGPRVLPARPRRLLLAAPPHAGRRPHLPHHASHGGVGGRASGE